MSRRFSRIALTSFLCFSLLSNSAAAATLYYNNAVAGGDSHWTTLSNWWIDSSYSSTSPTLPVDGDIVYIDGGGVYANLSPSVALSEIHIGEITGGSGIELHGVIGNAYFKGASYNEGDIIGNAVFEDNSYNGSNGYVIGHASFSGLAYNEGEVDGDATFIGDSYNGSDGDAGGNGSFSESTYNEGIVRGDAVFVGDSYNGSGGSVLGDAVFEDSTYNEGAVEGEAVFEGDSYNGSDGFVGEDAVFEDSTYNEGTVEGDAVFRDEAYNGSDGSVGGEIILGDEVSTTTVPAIDDEEAPAPVQQEASEQSNADEFIASSRPKQTSASRREANLAQLAIKDTVVAPSVEQEAIVISGDVGSDPLIAVTPEELEDFVEVYRTIVSQ